MGYLAIARKWRPSRFEDLVGQAHVVQTLKNAIRLDRVAHAYLFSGARGVGKTSVARIFAKALRCPNATEAVPCNTCPECLAISDSRSVDVMEIDGASNNGVEAVRGIRENVAYGASSGKYKIYIIDEVHMLSLSAFNALLKTLEEPPPHVIFLFATTEVQKLPLTILSRCQRFEFRRLTHTQIVERLERILAEEKVRVSEQGLRLLASHSDGSLRDALSLLDQVLSYFGDRRDAGETLDEAQIVEALGVNTTNQITAFLGHLIHKDTQAALTDIADSYAAGIDLKHFAERSLEELRLLYLLAARRDTREEISAESLDIAGQHFTELKALAGKTSLVALERMAQVLTKSIGQLAWSSLPRFVLEMAAVRLCHLQDLFEVEAALLSAPAPVARTPAPSPLPAAPQKREEPPPPVASAPVRLPSQPPPSEPDLEPVPPPVRVQAQPPLTGAQQQWRAFVDHVMKKRPLLGALLCHANFQIEGKTVTLAFPGNSFYERQAADSKTQIQDQLKAFLGPQATLVLSSSAGNTIKSIEQTKQAEAAGLKKTALEHPTVVKMQEILGAEVVDVNVDV